MQRKRSFWLVSIFLIIMSWVLAGCNASGVVEPELSAEDLAQTAIAATLVVEGAIQTGVAETLASSDQIDADEPEQAPVPTSTETLPPTITLTPTETLTPTPDKPMVNVSVNTNCRSGPGVQYDISGALMIGEQAEVVGASFDGGYWIIKNPDRAGECWLWGYYATVVGETAGLPKFTPPPTPTPAYNWTGTWTTSFGVTGMMHESIVINLTQTGSSVTGSFLLGGDTVNLGGTLSIDYLTLTGTWSDSTTSGPFVFKLVSANQFIGNRDSGEYEWCGHRAGAGLPSPCMGP